MANQRLAPRRLFMCRAQIAWSDSTHEHTIPGMIEDISASGIGIKVSKAIPVGTLLSITFRYETRSATVRRCIKANIGFFLGLEFVPEVVEVAPLSLEQKARA